MLSNYFKIALRNLWRNKTYSAINLFGLAFGIATCLLISFYILDELSYDRFLNHADRVYRINSDIRFGGSDTHTSNSSAPMAAALVQNYPEIEAAARILNQAPGMIWKGTEKIQEKEVYADSGIFEVLGIPMLSGNPKTALNQPHTVVITRKMALKYFDTVEALGKTLRVNGSDDYKVTGVIEDLPTTSHLKTDLFFTMLDNARSKEDYWLSHNLCTYLLLKPGVSPKKVERQMQELFTRQAGPLIQQTLGKSMAELEAAGSYIRYSLIPVTAIHLYSDRVDEMNPQSNIQYVYIFSAIAIFILLIACINFMNLATARSAHRAKEVGVRKVLGSGNGNLIGQFLTESVLLSLMAFAIALVMAELALPAFNTLADKQLSLSFFKDWYLLPVLLLFALLVGILAGSYPAFYLSAFEPAKVLKGTLTTGMRSGWLRSSLVVFQFFSSVFLIICTLAIYYQLTFIQKEKVGFNRDQVLMLNGVYGPQVQALKNEILRIPGVQNGTVTGYLPIPSWRGDNSFFPEGEVVQERAVQMQEWYVDPDYTKTLGLKIIAGRNFSPHMATDSSGIILNETAVKLFGYKDPIGKKISVLEDMRTGQTQELTVIGVVKNFNYESLRENVGALSLQLSSKPAGWANFRLKTQNLSETVGQIEQVWNKVMPGQPFQSQFMDEAFDSIYRSEQRIGKVFMAFAITAIVIACLGLFGLAAYSAERRTKEIGVRKVLGASEIQLITLLSSDFIRLIGIAFLIASPLAWYVMNRWLEGFAYRITLNVWLFLLAGGLALLVALLTVSSQAIRASLTNPVKSLKTE
ncbi:cell division protein FtsX [Siphonobacter sp. SORGH_AS_0500]|uniref:ABC transporter permease n=1 Tax=Siphonobacter sp. SORGH_AS_0500 TaxID=1864824 RepID=UPI000CB8E3CF|nr:ABC transporter permease [Siphonobacter sp. SORGH_AS_0500]PKK35646.1 cell division protein FtsX [Siphonobacter sp. SORGH_AS_0500]